MIIPPHTYFVRTLNTLVCNDGFYEKFHLNLGLIESGPQTIFHSLNSMAQITPSNIPKVTSRKTRERQHNATVV